ncbi:LysR family transcriptional regulator [Castellaniella caeni]|uniref:LysR family transcriptional regulator n=1 Tax=Castellaniella caeni TaxID=266123 RepID=UPI00083249CF|nr:LysR family transcriptional regulator [Castellaniella caeni]
MTVSIDQLAAFVAAAEHGSFSAAGRAVHKAQSAISTLVSSLEDDLGLALFSRAGRTPVLTEAGARLLREAQLILDRREHLIGVAASFESRVETRLVVAIDELYPERALAALFGDFARHFPHIELELLFPMMEDVSRMVLDGKADLGVMWRQEALPTELAFHTLGWVQLKLLVGLQHPFAREPVEWEDLKRHRQLMVAVRSEGPEKQRLRMAADVWWVESHWVILQLLRQGLGWALVPDHIVEDSPDAVDLLSPKLLFDDADWPVALEMVWHKQRPSGPAARWLRDRFAASMLGAGKPVAGRDPGRR